MVNTKIIAKDKSSGNSTVARGGSSSSFNSKTGTFVNIDANVVNANTLHVNDVEASTIDTEFVNATQGKIDALTGTQANIENGKFTELETVNFKATYGDINNIKASEIAAALANLDEVKSHNIVADNLTVLQSAHFFELIIDKIKSVGGAVILSPADGFDLYAYKDNTSDVQLFWRADQDGKSRYNMWAVNDQALCQNFNKVEVGQNYNRDTKFCWALVTATSGTQRVNVVRTNGIATIVSDAVAGNTHPIWRKEDFQPINGSMYKHNSTDVIITPEQYEALSDQEKASYALYNQVYFRVDADGTIDYIAKTVYDGTKALNGYYLRTYNQVDVVKCHWIKISKTDKATNSSFVFDIGDSFVQLGNKNDVSRQSAIYMSAYDSLDTGIHAPLIAQYTKINDYDLSSHRRSYFDRTSAKFFGTFYVEASGNYLNLGDEVAELRVDVDNITTTVSSMEVGAGNLIKRTSFESLEWMFGPQGTTETDIWRLLIHGFGEHESDYNGYVHTEIYDERTSAEGGTGDFIVDNMFYRMDTRQMGDFNWDVDGDSRFISFYQNLFTQSGDNYTCRLKPDTWYTLSFSIRGWNTTDNKMTKVYTMISNVKQGTYVNDVIVDGVPMENTSMWNKWAWTQEWNETLGEYVPTMRWNPISHHTYSFKTGSKIGVDNLYPQLVFRPNEDSVISIGEVQLEEGKIATEWRQSGYDTDYSFSKIEQRADSIELSVTDINNGLTTTGINIGQGTITLNAANTIINGNINMYASDGFIMRDADDEPRIVLLDGEVAKAGERKSQIITGGGTTTQAQQSITINSGAIDIGAYLDHQTIMIEYLRTIFIFPSISSLSPIDCTANIALYDSGHNQIAVTTATMTQDSTMKEQFALTTPVYITPLSSDSYTLEIEFEYFTYYSFQSGKQYSHRLDIRTNNKVQTYQAIGVDGARFKSDDDTELSIVDDVINIQQGPDNAIILKDDNIYRSALTHASRGRTITAYGDISSTMPNRTVTANSTYTLTKEDGLIYIAGNATDNTTIIMPEDDTIPAGKIWYVVHTGASTNGRMQAQGGSSSALQVIHSGSADPMPTDRYVTIKGNSTHMIIKFNRTGYIVCDL